MHTADGNLTSPRVDHVDAHDTLQFAPGGVIVEPTSGNTGIGLALVAMVKGYPIKIVLPENVSIERRQLLEIYGAEIISTPGGEGSNGAVRRAQELADEHPEWAFLYQYANNANPQAHYDGTGPEIWRDCPDVDVFVAGLGTSGTLMGVGRYLKEQRPEVRVVAVEPPAGELVQGLRSLDDGFIPPIIDLSLLDRKIMVRLVKGAYWDTEIKRAQVLGLAGYPVFTRKANTDVSYIACAKKLLSMTDRLNLILGVSKVDYENEGASWGVSTDSDEDGGSPYAGVTIRQILTHTAGEAGSLTFTYRPERLESLQRENQRLSGQVDSLQSSVQGQQTHIRELERVLTDDALHARLVASGLKEARARDWQREGNKLAQFFGEVAGW